MDQFPESDLGPPAVPDQSPVGQPPVDQPPVDQSPGDQPPVDQSGVQITEDPAPRFRRSVVVTTAVVVVALVATLSVVLTGGPAVPGAGMTPAAFVIASTQTTLAHRTADIVISGTVSASGTTIPLAGTGQADFTTGVFTANVKADGPGGSLLEHELVIGGHFYMAISSDGDDVSSIVTGKHWVQIPIPPGGTTSSLGTGTADPLAQLQLMAKRGNTVRPLGLSDIDGVSVAGYAITPSKKTMAQSIQRELSSPQLSAAARQQIRAASSDFSSVTTDVWFDASGLMRRIGVTVGASTATADVLMTFDNYGTPVNVSPPSPSDVVSYSAFVAAVQSAQAKAPAVQQ